MTETLTLGKALNLGLRRAMERDDKVVIMGEDVGKLGGVFRITDGLQKDFGEERVIDTPLAESGIIGTAIGLAIRGYRPVCEIQFDGFVYPGFDPIVFFEPKRRYWEKGEVLTDGDPEPLHASRVARSGTDCTLVAYGPMMRTCLEAATAAEEDGRSVEVIDLRSLSPLDMAPVFESVRKTGRIVVVH